MLAVSGLFVNVCVLLTGGRGCDKQILKSSSATVAPVDVNLDLAYETGHVVLYPVEAALC